MTTTTTMSGGSGIYRMRLAQAANRTAAQVNTLWNTYGTQVVLGAAVGGLQQVVTTGQFNAAAIAADYVMDEAMDQLRDRLFHAVEPRAFTGRAASGMPLAQVMQAPVDRMGQEVLLGRDPGEASAAAGSRLSMIARNECQQAGNNAAAAGIVGEPRFEGFVRVVVPPACGRCLILAGRRYKSADAFQRHPRCDCVHKPQADLAEGDIVDPYEYFDQMSAADQDRLFGKANAEAIRNGADMGDVVNVNQRGAGMRAFQTGDGPPVRRRRLTPQDIHEQAVGDVDEYRRLLVDNGYLKPRPPRVTPAKPTITKSEWDGSDFFASVDGGDDMWFRRRLDPETLEDRWTYGDTGKWVPDDLAGALDEAAGFAKPAAAMPKPAVSVRKAAWLDESTVRVDIEGFRELDVVVHTDSAGKRVFFDTEGNPIRSDWVDDIAAAIDDKAGPAPKVRRPGDDLADEAAALREEFSTRKIGELPPDPESVEALARAERELEDAKKALLAREKTLRTEHVKDPKDWESLEYVDYLLREEGLPTAYEQAQIRVSKAKKLVANAFDQATADADLQRIMDVGHRIRMERQTGLSGYGQPRIGQELPDWIDEYRGHHSGRGLPGPDDIAVHPGQKGGSVREGTPAQVMQTHRVLNEVYPADWVDRWHASDRTLRVGQVKRAHFQGDGDYRIAFTVGDEDSIVAHELGHSFQRVNPNVTRAEQAFLAHRYGWDATWHPRDGGWVPTVRSPDAANPKDVPAWYSAKGYSSGAWKKTMLTTRDIDHGELFTTAIQDMVQQREAGYMQYIDDDEMQDWLWGVMTCL